MSLIDYLDKEKIKKVYGDDVLVIDRKHLKENYISKDEIESIILELKERNKEYTNGTDFNKRGSLFYQYCYRNACYIEMLEDLLIIMKDSKEKES